MLSMTEVELIKQCRYYRGEEDNPFEKELESHEVDKSMLPPPECMHTEYRGLTAGEVHELCYKSTVWGYERTWVQFVLSGDEADYLQEIVGDFVRAGLEDLNEVDDTPISLKAVLFNRYIHWGGGYSGAKSFREWYQSVR